MARVLGVRDGSIGASIELTLVGSVTIPKKTFKIAYDVTATLSETEDDVLDAPGIPPRWYPINGAVCVSHDANLISNIHDPNTGVIGSLWEVVAYFDTRAVPDDCEDDVLCKRPSIRWYGETEEEVLEWEPETGRNIVTTADEKLIITKPVTIAVLEIKRYENAPFDPLVILAFGNRTNSKTFYGAPPGSALMMPPTSEEEVIKNVTYCNCTYVIKFKFQDYSIVKLLGEDGNETFLDENVDSWAAHPLNAGYMHRKKKGNKPQVALDKGGQPITVNLDKDGVILPPGEKGVHLFFRRHRKIDFNMLSLGPF